ncbi:cleavage stimulation factor subunit 3-like isoform X4 [Gordionus sp. m RMFG-2023]|uniref:cleavage stimulation factor subunit 3-like isoform X1 n=1 Tax=Gordionus sp. m RMFG-2023 TaxID=3053472 RepID=UPI0031FC4802
MSHKSSDNSLYSERINKASNKIDTDPYDIESWNILLKDAKTKSIETARETFERVITQFPNQGKFWKIYIEKELKAKNYENVEKLFQRSLVKILNIDLWICYLNYVKQAKANQPGFKEKLAQAYEFALEKIGLDYRSYPIWSGQIDFLKTIDAVGSYAENQRIAAIRKIYHKVCVTPLFNMEQFWRDYISFEQAINPLIAKRLSDELSKEYMNARRALKEIEAITRGLNKYAPPVPFLGAAQIKQIEIWKKYLQWEKSNPMNYDDKNMVTKRVVYAYEQALLSMSYVSELWIDAGTYLQKASKQLSDYGDEKGAKALLDKVGELYERANTTFFKTHLLMHFIQSDFEEMRKNQSKAGAVYVQFLDLKHKSISSNDITLAYIQYMRYSKRTDGIKAARIIFKKAREDARCNYHIFICAALMEYYSSKDKNIALKIFELGLKKFSTEIKYLKEYIKFSLNLNEDNNTRVLFERLLSLTFDQLSPEATSELWNMFLHFEIEVGDLNNVLKIQQRRLAASHKIKDGDSDISQLLDRYGYGDLMPHTSLLTCPPSISPHSSQLITSTTTHNPTNDLIPDVEQMLPFKPAKSTFYGNESLNIPGGLYAYPPAVNTLLEKLPPPMSFSGPFVILDQFLTTLANSSLETAKITKQSEQGNITGNLTKQIQISSPKSFASPKVVTTPNPYNAPDDNDHNALYSLDDNSENYANTPPINDIYRLRQQKKIK